MDNFSINKKLASFYGMHRNTISNYKNSSDIHLQRRYESLLSYYNTPNLSDRRLDEMTNDELFRLHEYFSDRIEHDTNILQCIVDFLHDHYEKNIKNKSEGE